MTFYVNYITYLLVTLISSVVRYSGHYNLILRTKQYYIPKLIYSIGIQHGAVRMSQKNENNSAESNSRNSSSEESGDKKGRTTTHQKITLPKFEKKTIQEAKLWWRQFTQYVKMTQKIDLNTMTTDKEILEEYREELEITIKDIFIWALGEEAVTEMTKTVRDNDPNKMNINQLYIIFRIHFIPERNKFHSRADFFGITRETNETAEDVWTRILQTEKNCEFDNVTPAELFASKFLSLIGRSTGDYELKKKSGKVI